MDVNPCLLIWSLIKIVSKKYLGVKLMFDTSIELSTRKKQSEMVAFFILQTLIKTRSSS